MSPSVVALVPCADYEEERVYEAVRDGLALLGGAELFVKPEEKILLKPNLLSKALPQKAITTHPAVFSAVCRLLREAGCERLFYGDSPGNPVTSPEAAADMSGIRAEAERWGVEKAEFNLGSPVAFPEGKTCRSFFLCKGVQEAEAVINLPKMKTHALERITGAMKNLYGCIWGANKAAGHVRFPNSYVFADMLADLQRCVAPRLHIMDGVTAMEGNGPTSGTPVDMGLLLLSADPVALDAVFAALVYLDPALVPTNLSGQKAGLGRYAASDILVRTPEGDMSLPQVQARWGKPEFDVFRGKLKKSFLAKILPLLPFLQERPVVERDKCIACGLCEKACPVPSKAVRSGNGQKAEYDYSKCIRCFCCQEMCPAKAIAVKRPFGKK